MSQVGHLALFAAAGASALALAFALAAWRGRAEVWAARARAAVFGAGASLALAAAALTWLLISGDMRCAYVAAHTESSLGVSFRIAAFWSGQEGSLLLWACLVSLMVTASGLARGSDGSRAGVVATAVGAAVVGFFALVLLAAADPFAPGDRATDGRGLSPLLQHWAMIAHPPVLFAGYSASIVPFALALGALFGDLADDGWVIAARRWATVSWVLLTTGIALGAWWAYVQLGWGGYWAWDPVENASLLPWLTCTGLVHTLAIHRRRGALRAWSFALASLTFILCIVGTWLTRSGAVQSVHSFDRSTVGGFFLVFIAVLVAGAVVPGIVRRERLRTPARVELLIGSEGIMLAANMLLVTTALVTLAGTLLPAVSGPLTGKVLSVGPEFYHRAVVPLGLGAGVLMAVGPIFGPAGALGARRPILHASLAACAALGAVAVLGVRSPAALATVAIAAFTLFSLAARLVQSASARARNTGEALAIAAFRVIEADHRRYGGHLAHAGFAIVLLATAASSVYGVSESATLHEGRPQALGSGTLTLHGLRQIRGDTYSAIEATITVDRAGRSVTVNPQARFYDTSEQTVTQAAIDSTWREDVYVALVGWQAGGHVAGVQVRVAPMVAWIWVGAGAMVGGGILVLLPHMAPRRAPRTNPGAARPPQPLTEVPA